MTEEDRIKKMEDNIRRLQTELEDLRTQVNEPPLVQKMLKYIKSAKVTTSTDLRRQFPSCYGGNLAKLHAAIERSKGFRIIPGARWAPTVYAYFGINGNPTTSSQMAIDYFNLVGLSRKVTTSTSMGKKAWTWRGPAGSMQEIQNYYDITKEQAYEVWVIILKIFDQRVIVNQSEKKFYRKY